MARTLNVAVVTPEGIAYEDTASSVVIPAHDGEVAFLPGHAPFVGAIGVGSLRIADAKGQSRAWYLEGGVAQALDDEVTVLADRIQPVEKLDRAEAEADLREALREVPTTDEAFAARDHQAEAARARLRLT